MREINDKEMMEVDGGANHILVGTIIGVVITFVVGVLHGFSNPKKCN